jgi:hypothetical protein
VEPDVLAAVIDRSSRPGQAQRLDHLDHAVEPFLRVGKGLAPRRERRRPVARPDAELEPPSAQDRQDRRLLGQHARLVVEVVEDHRQQLDARRAGRDRTER